ncbi:MAG: DUF3775 domain-containing protein [Rhodospirillaceae bacterium]
MATQVMEATMERTHEDRVKRVDVPANDRKAQLSIPLTKLAFLVVKARAYDAEVPPVGLEDGSDMTDDNAVAALEDTKDNPTREELGGALAELNVDQINEVLAIMWIGRGDYDEDQWQEALTAAREASNRRVIKYLLETPLLADLLEEGLDRLGYNVSDEETGLA